MRGSRNSSFGSVLYNKTSQSYLQTNEVMSHSDAEANESVMRVIESTTSRGLLRASFRTWALFVQARREAGWETRSDPGYHTQMVGRDMSSAHGPT